MTAQRGEPAKGPCVFCEIVAERAPATVRASWLGALVIEPLNPVTPGHMLVIPREHLEDGADRGAEEGDWRGLDFAVALARKYVQEERIGDCNLITSRGPAATQTVRHLHLHIVPRRIGDGLALPWTGQS